MEKLTAYINETLPELHDLIVTLCGIPAPSHTRRSGRSSAGTGSSGTVLIRPGCASIRR